MLTRCLGFLALPWQHHDYMQVKPKIAFVDIGLSFLFFFLYKSVRSLHFITFHKQFGLILCQFNDVILLHISSQPTKLCHPVEWAKGFLLNVKPFRYARSFRDRSEETIMPKFLVQLIHGITTGTTEK